MIKVNIVNVVATASLNQKIDLYELERFREIIHDPEIYGGRVAYFKSSKMKGKVSIFTSGQMISVGTKSEKEATYELEIVKDFLVRKRVIEPVVLNCTIRNIVVTISLEKTINLEVLAKKHKFVYEPEQFPGGILKIEKPFKASILIFASGKSVIAGLTSSLQIEPVVRRINKMIEDI